MGKIISCVGDEVVAEVDSGKTPKLGKTVSFRGKAFGRVVDVIGNVRKPYCVVKLLARNQASYAKLVGEKIVVGT